MPLCFCGVQKGIHGALHGVCGVLNGVRCVLDGVYYVLDGVCGTKNNGKGADIPSTPLQKLKFQ